MIDQPTLEALHVETNLALDRRDHTSLNVLGFGEVSIALGCPTENPSVVCKRLPPATHEQLAAYRQVLEDYLRQLAQADVDVVPTRLMSVQQGDQHVGYLVQDLLPAASIGGKVLRANAPDAEHPFLVALTTNIAKVTSRVSIDSQVTNWSWTGASLTLLDVGTPFAWHRDGNLAMDLDPALAMLPAVVRRMAKKDLTTLIDRWKRPRGVAVDVVANLYREKLTDWVDPTIHCFNTSLDLSEPIRADEARVVFEEDKKTFPRLKKMQQVERAWRTNVRRRRYDFFIAETTYA